MHSERKESKKERNEIQGSRTVKATCGAAFWLDHGDVWVTFMTSQRDVFWKSSTYPGVPGAHQTLASVANSDGSLHDCITVIQQHLKQQVQPSVSAGRLPPDVLVIKTGIKTKSHRCQRGDREDTRAELDPRN